LDSHLKVGRRFITRLKRHDGLLEYDRISPSDGPFDFSRIELGNGLLRTIDQLVAEELVFRNETISSTRRELR
jgi:hypothetical protein